MSIDGLYRGDDLPEPGVVRGVARRRQDEAAHQSGQAASHQRRKLVVRRGRLYLVEHTLPAVTADDSTLVRMSVEDNPKVIAEVVIAAGEA